jgi:NAD(P)-dependent dehydrogenase (short-subunit alcohol dehydrogenase family)
VSAELDGRVVIVTGATAGLGRAYAVALAQAGADVVVSGRRSEPLHELSGELGGAPAVAGDVGDRDVAQRLVDTALSTYGRVDAVVNNAGAVRDRTLLKMSDDEFDEVIRGHVYGTFYVTRACARAMRSQGSGAVINIGSDSMIGAFGQSNYAAAKGAILGMTLTWARELARYGITCNCVLPNALTAMTEELPELLAAYRYGPPEAFPRALGSAAEVAPLIVLLASDRGRGLNGLLLSLGGDKLSIWQPPAETNVAFLNGGWTVAELERSMEFALGIDLSTTQRSLDGVTHG